MGLHAWVWVGLHETGQWGSEGWAFCAGVVWVGGRELLLLSATGCLRARPPLKNTSTTGCPTHTHPGSSPTSPYLPRARHHFHANPPLTSPTSILLPRDTGPLAPLRHSHPPPPPTPPHPSRHDMIILGTKFLMDANNAAPTFADQTLCPPQGGEERRGGGEEGRRRGGRGGRAGGEAGRGGGEEGRGA